MPRGARLIVVIVLALAACGGDDTGAPATAPSSVVTQPVRATTTTTSTSTTTSTTSTTIAATTTTPPPATTPATAALPVPAPPPAEDGTSEPQLELGTIEIPKIGLSASMWEGIKLSTLDRGPGHWPGTAMPGDVGNVVVAGHRVSHNADFRRVDRLVAGDDVVMTTAAGSFTYKVVSTEVVQPDALWIVDQTPARSATLFACHPPGSVRQRIVVHLELAT
jgi:sortase A